MNAFRKFVLSVLSAASFLGLFSIAAPAFAATPVLSATAAVTVPGAPATITGASFAPGEKVFITFGSHTTEVTANGSGSFSATLPIPPAQASLQFSSAWGESSGTWALAYLWVAGFNPAVTPSAWYILPGTMLSFTGSGFAPNETVTATYASSTLGTFTTDSSGAFSGQAARALPLPLMNTTATITFTGSVSHAQTSNTITIGQLYPSITPSSWYTPAGSSISLTGSGFAPNESVAIVAGARSTSATADTSGAFSVSSLQLPASASGALTITATGSLSKAAASAQITIAGLTPWLTFSTYWAQGGSPFIIYGNSFAPGESISLSSGNTALGTTTANTSGAFTFGSLVPYAPAGNVTITGTGANSGAAGTGTLTVAPVYVDLQLKSYAGAPGQPIEFIGHGFLPNEPVQITTDRTATTIVATFTADATGNFDSTYTVPASFAPGKLTLTAFGTHSFTTTAITYYVTGG